MSAEVANLDTHLLPAFFYVNLRASLLFVPLTWFLFHWSCARHWWCARL